MFDRQLTDRRVVESILRAERLEIEFEPADGQADHVRYTIYSLDPTDGRPYIFGEGLQAEIWSALRQTLEEKHL
jgi:hypothetical protein